MRNFTYIMTGVIVLFSSISELKAQNLYVLEKNGQQTSYGIASLNKMYFASGELMLELQNGTSDNYPLNGIRYLSFNETLRIPPLLHSEILEMKLYPNPVSGSMYIYCNMPDAKTIKLEIISTDGRLVHSENLSSENEMPGWQVKLAALPKGFYMCRVQSDKFIITKKFIKN
ncbi:MAG: T9SS type A sorting domain-containing protein [Bacteroidota bacterium]|nr:T9SS type A sorting domain-containing protein [Bacteroidota bacterium]